MPDARRAVLATVGLASFLAPAAAHASYIDLFAFAQEIFSGLPQDAGTTVDGVTVTPSGINPAGLRKLLQAGFTTTAFPGETFQAGLSVSFSEPVHVLSVDFIDVVRQNDYLCVGSECGTDSTRVGSYTVGGSTVPVHSPGPAFVTVAPLESPELRDFYNVDQIFRVRLDAGAFVGGSTAFTLPVGIDASQIV